MGTRRFKTCFISAPIGVDTRPLREALTERGVTVWDAADTLTGPHVPRTVKSLIAEADFVCAVIPADPSSGAVYFELGLAAGMDRPRLLFVDPKASLPVALREESSARASLDNAGGLRFHLDIFLKNAGRRSGERGTGRQPAANGDHARLLAALDQLAAWEALDAPPRETELVRFLADVFEAAGYIATTAPSPMGNKGARPDLAVWIDEVHATVGNPLLIEVISQWTSNASRLRSLQQVLLESQSPLGLVVGWRLETLPISDIWGPPTIVAMSVREVLEAIGRGDFARTLLTHRNTLVHSAA
jgi:hypothetical protein